MTKWSTVLYSIYQWDKEHAVHVLTNHIGHSSLMFNRNYNKCKLFYKIKLKWNVQSTLVHGNMNSSIFKKTQKWLGIYKAGKKRSFLTAVAQVLRHLKMNVLVIYKTKPTTHFENKTWQLNPWWNNYSRFYLLSFLYPTNSNKGDISTFLVWVIQRKTSGPMTAS